MAHKPFQSIAFFVFLGALFLLVVFMARPFISILAVSVMAAILIEPLQRRIMDVFKSRTISAILAVLIVAMGVSLILILAGRLLASEISIVYDHIQSGDLVINKDQIIQNIPGPIRDGVQDITQNLNNLVSQFSNQELNSLTAIASNIASFAAQLIIMVIATFYLLRDAPKIKNLIIELSPLASKQEDVLLKKIVASVNGVIRGSLLTALCHGVSATIGFTIFGIPNPLVWGFFTVLLAIIPTIGAPTALGSGVIYFLITGHIPQAIGLAIWAFFSIGLIDNLVGPNIVGARVQIHPLLVMIGVLGGLLFFGPLGFLIGPTVMAIFVATVEIYRTDFKDYFFK